MQKFNEIITQQQVKKLFLVLSIIGLTLSLVFFGTMFFRRVRGDREGVGKIIELTESQLKVENRKHEVITVIIKPDTEIFYQPQKTNLTEGELILVTGKKTSTTTIEASFITVLPDPKK